MSYEIGWHSSDERFCHVSQVEGGAREDLFDVALYDPEVIESDGRTAHAASLAALERLVAKANAYDALPDDTESSASRQHNIDTGRYLKVGEAENA